MDFARRLEEAQTLADIFELVKRAVETVLGRSRAGLMLALADLGNSPQGFLGAFYPIATNVIVMNKVPLIRIQETNPDLYRHYAFSCTSTCTPSDSSTNSCVGSRRSASPRPSSVQTIS